MAEILLGTVIDYPAWSRGAGRSAVQFVSLTLEEAKVHLGSDLNVIDRDGVVTVAFSRNAGSVYLAFVAENDMVSSAQEYANLQLPANNLTAKNGQHIHFSLKSHGDRVEIYPLNPQLS